VADLTWDHVPPKGGIDLSTVKMQSILHLMTSDQKNQKLRESQNGLKFRTLCGDCNSFLGSEYDQEVNRFSKGLATIFESEIELPSKVNFKLNIQRLLKGMIGHLVAAKISEETTVFDEEVREYVLDREALLPENVHIFYWVYPYKCTVIMRDFLMFTPRGTFRDPAVFQMLKYYPVAFLVCNRPDYANLDCLSKYGRVEIDQEITLNINTAPRGGAYWPEAPSDKENNVLVVGEDGANSVHAMAK